MSNSVVIFFSASSNHLSNVKTLQSIYAQDYPHIRVVVCNDCTYGFESERLLNNFEHNRPSNIEHILFRENRVPMGIYHSQAPLWKRLEDEYILTLHAGEYFTAPTVLSSCIQKLAADPTAAAVVCGCEYWSNDFKMLQTKITPAAVLPAVAEKGEAAEEAANLQDCMVLYRVAALRDLPDPINDDNGQLSQHAVPQLLQSGKRILTQELCACKFSQASMDPMVASVPDTFGKQTVENISRLLQEADTSNEEKDMLFGTVVESVPKKNTRNIFVILLKLSTISRILAYAGFSLLLFIAAGLFLNLQGGLFAVLGIGFLVAAIMAVGWTFGMLACNVYLKKNPQRLVS